MKIINKYYFLTAILVMLIAGVAVALSKSTFSAERLESAVLHYVKSNVKYESEISIISMINDKTYDDNNVTAAIIHNTELIGLTQIYIEFRNDERLIDRQKINVRVKLFAQIPVAASEIEKGKYISESDIVYKNAEITELNLSEILQKNRIVGKKATEKILKNFPLLSSNLTSDVMITRGEKVEVIAISGAVQIKTFGVAMNDAKAGEMIRVKRDGNSKKVIMGRVSESGSVILSTSNLMGENK